MSGNSFGRLFVVTTFGESHGPALGCVVDGCPPGMALSEADIQQDLEHQLVADKGVVEVFLAGLVIAGGRPGVGRAVDLFEVGEDSVAGSHLGSLGPVKVHPIYPGPPFRPLRRAAWSSVAQAGRTG